MENALLSPAQQTKLLSDARGKALVTQLTHRSTMAPLAHISRTVSTSTTSGVLGVLVFGIAA